MKLIQIINENYNLEYDGVMMYVLKPIYCVNEDEIEHLPKDLLKQIKSKEYINKILVCEDAINFEKIIGPQFIKELIYYNVGNSTYLVAGDTPNIYEDGNFTYWTEKQIKKAISCGYISIKDLQISTLLTNHDFIENKFAYEDFIKRKFVDNSLLTNKWLTYAQNIRSKN